MDEYGSDNDVDSTAANYRFVTEQPQHRMLEDSNAYPDPEDIPSYPWFGSSANHKADVIPKPSFASSDTLKFRSNDADVGDDTCSDTDESLHIQVDYNDTSVDPDFQYSDDSSAYVHLLFHCH